MFLLRCSKFYMKLLIKIHLSAVMFKLTAVGSLSINC